MLGSRCCAAGPLGRAEVVRERVGESVGVLGAVRLRKLDLDPGGADFVVTNHQ